MSVEDELLKEGGRKFVDSNKVWSEHFLFRMVIYLYLIIFITNPVYFPISEISTHQIVKYC